MKNPVSISGRIFDLPVDHRGYWQDRLHHDLYRLTVALARGLFFDAKSAIDVGCFTSGILVELDWIERRVASDISKWIAPNWEHVEGVEFVAADAFSLQFPAPFDLVLSNQTVEHLDDPKGFIEKLLKLGRGLIVSTTYETPAGLIEGHVQDPISLDKFRSWFPCELDAWTICRHPSSPDIKHVIGVVKRFHPARVR